MIFRCPLFIALTTWDDCCGGEGDEKGKKKLGQRKNNNVMEKVPGWQSVMTVHRDKMHSASLWLEVLVCRSSGFKRVAWEKAELIVQQKPKRGKPLSSHAVADGGVSCKSLFWPHSSDLPRVWAQKDQVKKVVKVECRCSFYCPCEEKK